MRYWELPAIIGLMSAFAFGQTSQPASAPATSIATLLAAGDSSLVYGPADLSSWKQISIGGKDCRLSPIVDGGAGCEVNHHRVKVTWSGRGQVQICVLHSTSDNLTEAVANGKLHSGFEQARNGQDVLVTSPYSRERFAWVALRPDDDVHIQEVRHTLWRGRGAIYGHVPGRYEFAKGTLPYRLMFPRNYDPHKAYPLVLSIHGSGGVGTDNASSMETVILARYLFTQYYFDKDLECFSLVAQIPPADPKGMSVPAPFFPNGDKGKPTIYHSDWPMVNENGFYAQATLSLIESLIKSKECNIDQNRIYCAGFSYGGKACWELLKEGREVFAGAISGAGWPIGTAFTPATASERKRLQLEVQRYKHVPVRIFAGDRDGMRLTSQVVNKEIAAQGGDSLFTEFPNCEHVPSANRIWSDRKNILWLLNQNRKNNPTPGKDPFPGGDYKD